MRTLRRQGVKATTSRAGSDEAAAVATAASAGAEADRKPLEILPSATHLQRISS